MRRTFPIILLLSVFMMPMQAQESRYRYDDAVQLWRLTNNPAGLGIDSSRNRGFALFNVEHQNGSYARVQEGTQTNQLRFQTERYQKVGKYLYGYGRFDFDYGRTKNRTWCDVMRPYNANPYFSGSSVDGKYDFQNFDFTAELGTVPFFGRKDSNNGLRFGLRLDYNVGDLSRLRDPRSRSQLLDYKVTPAVTYSFGQHTIGLSGNYHRRKEKIIGVTTVQQDPTLKYYLMSGLENVQGTVGGYSSFSREWVDHILGGELSYGFKNQKWNSLLSLSIARGEENAYEKYMYEPGRYVHYDYGVSLRNRLTTKKVLHQLDLSFNYQQSYADEYRQQLHQETDAETGFTSYFYENSLTYKKRYQAHVFDADIHYRACFLKNQQQQAYIGLRYTTDGAENKRLLPDSKLCYGSNNITLEGGLCIIRHLWIDLWGTRHWAKDATLDLSDPTTDYAKGVLLPDMEYYQANYWRGHLQLTYEIPLKIKGKTSHWFIRAYGDYLKTNNSLDSKCAGLSIGLFN